MADMVCGHVVANSWWVCQVSESGLDLDQTFRRREYFIITARKYEEVHIAAEVSVILLRDFGEGRVHGVSRYRKVASDRISQLPECRVVDDLTALAEASEENVLGSDPIVVDLVLDQCLDTFAD